jgi:TDG/mug DNA glycosylase family protein
MVRVGRFAMINSSMPRFERVERAARPSKADLQEAYGATIPDLGGPQVRVLLVGINPSLWSGWAGLHFARPGNRLWRTLHEAGFTDRVLDPSEVEEIATAGLGITNLVARATARADELAQHEIRDGLGPLRLLVRQWRPAIVAFLGISTFRIAFERPRARVGPQDEEFEAARVWVLPNPSGLNASYQQPALTSSYAELCQAAR